MGQEEIYLGAEEKIEKTLELLTEGLRKVRTGRASPALVEGLRADYYGTPTPLKQIAQISVADAQLLVIRPFDAGALQAIEKAIQKSDLGLSPATDGKIIRLPIPSLSEERRKQMVGLVNAQAEQAKVAIRNVRRDALKQVDDEEKKGGIPEDDAERARDEIQAMIKKYEGRVEDLVKKKSDELLKI